MSGHSRTRRAVATALCSALLASTFAVSAGPTAAAQSPALLSSGSSAGSSTAGSSVSPQSCNASGAGTCSVDNTAVAATATPVVGNTTVTTSLELVGLVDSIDDVTVLYTATGLENIHATSTDDVVISQDPDGTLRATVRGGMKQGEKVTVSITADLVSGAEGSPSQAIGITTHTGTPPAVGSAVGSILAALGLFALIEHAHNMHWIPREADQLLHLLTDRDPELSRAQWTLF